MAQRLATPGEVRKPRVLVVDDERDFASAVQRFLVGRGFDVEVADSTHAALELVQRGEFNAATIDLHLPDVDGLALLSEIRGLNPASVAIVLTGSHDFVMERKARALGAVEYLVKPVALEDIEAALIRALRTRGDTQR